MGHPSGPYSVRRTHYTDIREDRPTDRLTDRQADRKTDRKTDRHIDQGIKFSIEMIKGRNNENVKEKADLEGKEKN